MTPRTPTRGLPGGGAARGSRAYHGMAGTGYIGRGALPGGSQAGRQEMGVSEASEGLLRLLAKALVSKPDEVKVSGVRREGLSILLLEVAKDDVGRVIGKQGRIIKAIRKVVRTTGGPAGKSLVVEVVPK